MWSSSRACSRERGDDRRVRNTVVAVDASGVIATYRKLHLYDAFGQRESDWIEPGGIEGPETFELAGLRFGLMTCYDLRFPEVARLLVDAGADVFLVPAEWVRGPLKEHHWSTLLHARAIENTVFVAAADHPPPLGVGHSMIIDPQGVQIAAVGTGTGVAVAHLDLSRDRPGPPGESVARPAAAQGRPARLSVSRRACAAGRRPRRAPRAACRRRTARAWRTRVPVLRRGERGERDRHDAGAVGERAAEVGGIRRPERAGVRDREIRARRHRHLEAGGGQPCAEHVALDAAASPRCPSKNESGRRSPVAVAGWKGAPLT